MPIAESPAAERPSSLAGELAAFRYRGHPTHIAERNGIPRFSNEFWTSGQRQASRLHEVSYRACFKPQLPAFFIERLTRAGDAVYDPFMGRGTTPLQAALTGRRPVGSDINPLSAMLLAPRLAPPPLEDIAARLAEIPPSAPLPEEPLLSDLRVFFHDSV
ncbi:MAG: site-specific DNA-methyltransferase, partial [Alphaproteobacteria bacterium]|nr:site-specific DNA-methyltransferase [Alphaproteobacteria bacterium]